MNDAGGRRLLVDTNIFLRFLTGDDPSKAAVCKELFETAEARGIELHTNELVLAELVWTLRSYYSRTREQIVDALGALASLRGLRLTRRAVLEDCGPI